MEIVRYTSKVADYFSYSDKAKTFIALSLKSCAFFGDDIFTA